MTVLTADEDLVGYKDEEPIFRKISWHLLPLFLVMVLLCYIDRTNLAFAAIQLNEDLHFTPSIFGLGSGIFFLAYATLQIPCNLILKHTRANVYLATIIFMWGACACAFAWMKGPGQFYALRLLLGATEAGAFPGMWFYLAKFYPSDRITIPYAIVDCGVSLSHVVAAPLAAACLSLTGFGGMKGWQWLFLLEGAPTLLLAVFMLYMVPNSPEEASFLLPSERIFLAARILQRRSSSPDVQSVPVGEGMHASPSASHLLPTAALKQSNLTCVKSEHSRKQASSHNVVVRNASPTLQRSPGQSATLSAAGGATSEVWADLKAAFSNKFVWYLGAVKFFKDIAGFGIIFWTPSVVQSILDGNTMHLHSTSSNSAAMSANATLHRPDSKAASSHIRTLLSLAAAAGTSNGHAHASGVRAALLTAVPFAAATLFSFFVAARSQRLNEKIMHVSVPFMVAGSLYALFPLALDAGPFWGFACLTIGIMGVYSSTGTLVALLQELSSGPGFVIAGPLFNSIGNIGGFIGPYMVGALAQRLGSYAVPSLLMAACLFLSGLLVCMLPHMLALPQNIRVGFWNPKLIHVQDR
ncbi:hypothetical protein CEUSTIGMA_g8242.t1 [Chlamydomonas eustigma]|uniref:Major facilitator superfamily (MFS) profile domain-containing protein n=1 Tax=Chlamydomonas eustigma TaxID=1157962 RepID=A0A250XCM2_9CHLO|nr:hypothetical protein CEUSTIGMA_g8242.t1 [Chlamydomonas eustigma]|eukprot:GAX80806.1 hypothetical protein CEUSTIGMA_g8242.t1 [Chlamydomonas eustigma]